MSFGSFGDSSTSWLVGSSGSTTATYGITYVTDSGTQAEVKLGKQKGTRGIGATLYLKYVKSKLGKVQQERSKKRLAKLQKLVMYSKDMGQRALYEELCGEIAVLVREAEMVSYGIDSWVDFVHIDKYLDKVRDKTIKWLPLEKFPRVVPKKVQTKIRQLEKAAIFDEMWVLFLDYTKQDLKTTKEKIRNKDPILFGKFAHQEDRYYFIADWVDEYCDLTLDKFVESFKDEDPDFGVDKVEDITEERWKNIVQEVKDRQKRLKETKSDNWRELEKEEAKAETAKLKEPIIESIALAEEAKPKRKWWRPWHRNQ